MNSDKDDKSNFSSMKNSFKKHPRSWGFFAVFAAVGVISYILYLPRKKGDTGSIGNTTDAPKCKPAIEVRDVHINVYVRPQETEVSYPRSED